MFGQAPQLMDPNIFLINNFHKNKYLLGVNFYKEVFKIYQCKVMVLIIYALHVSQTIVNKGIYFMSFCFISNME